MEGDEREGDKEEKMWLGSGNLKGKVCKGRKSNRNMLVRGG